MARAVAVWAGCALALSAADVTPETIRLARIRYHMAQNLTQVPNYTCTQTIERSARSSKAIGFSPI